MAVIRGQDGSKEWSIYFLDDILSSVQASISISSLESGSHPFTSRRRLCGLDSNPPWSRMSLDGVLLW